MSEKKKNILVTQDYDPLKGTGISVATFGIAKELAKLGCNVTFASYCSPEESDQKLVEGVLIVKLRTMDDLKGCVKKAGLVINVLSFSALFKPFGVTVGFICEKMKVPYVPWVHTTLQNSKFNNVFDVNDYVQETALFLTAEMMKGSKCKKVIAVSEAVKDSVIALGVDPKKVEVIFNGLDVQKILNNVKEVTEKTNDVICIQRLSAEKSSTLTLAVLANLKRLVPDLKGVIVGEGSDKDLVMSLIKVFGLENNVRVISKIKNGDLTKEIARSKTFLSTSLTESFGLAIAESMLVGTPVVAPNIEGPKELTDSGKFGFVFESGDTVKPAELIADVLLSKNKNVGPIVKKAQQKAVGEFDIAKQAQKFLTLLDRINV